MIDIELSQVLIKLRDILGERHITAYLTGGFMRDAIAGRAIADVDVVVAVDSMQLAPLVAHDLGGKWFPLDEENRIARVIVERPRHLHLDLATIHGSIEEDLARRDFTINAIAVDLQEIGKAAPRIVDYMGGQQDIEARRIRATSEEALRQDPLRMMRGPRLAAELGFSIDSWTKALIKRNHNLVSLVAAERVRNELCRLLAMPGAAKWLCLLDELGLLLTVLPELGLTKGAEQPKEHFWDVFQHSIETVNAVEFLLRINDVARWDSLVLIHVPWSPALKEHFDQEISGGRTRKELLKLAGLLHDIAKPQTRSLEANGRMRFFGHAKEGACVVEDILYRLRFSVHEIQMVKRMVEHHLRPGQMGEGAPSSRAIYRYFRDTGDEGIDTIFLNLADHLATRGPNLELDGWQAHTCAMAYVLEERFKEENLVAPPKLISGHDLMAVCGMKPGPEMGEVLEAVREAQAAGEVSTREEALTFVERRIIKE